MTVRGTLALVGVLVLLVAVTLLDRPGTRPAIPPPLLTAPADEVTRVEVVWPTGRVDARRHGGHWRDAQGRSLPEDAVDDVLAALATVRPLDTLSLRGDEAADYGFGADPTTLGVFAGDRALVRLDVGVRNPAWTGLYVRRPATDEVLLVGALLHWELEKLRAASAP